MSYDINAINHFDPSKWSYLEVVEDAKGEKLQLAQKNIFQMFVLWLGRIFGCCQNRSTSMVKVAEFVSKHIEAMSRDPELTKAGLERFLGKIVQYNDSHDGSIRAALKIIFDNAEKAPVYVCPLEADARVSLEAFDKVLVDEGKSKNYIYQLTLANFEKFLENSDAFKNSRLYNVLKTIPDEICLKTFMKAYCNQLVRTVEIEQSKKLNEILNEIIFALPGDMQLLLVKHIISNQTTQQIIEFWEKPWINEQIPQDTKHFVTVTYIEHLFETEQLSDVELFQKSSVEICLRNETLSEKTPVELKLPLTWLLKNVDENKWKEFLFIKKVLQDEKIALKHYKELGASVFKQSILEGLCSQEVKEAIQKELANDVASNVLNNSSAEQ